MIALPRIFVCDTWKYLVSATGEEYAVDGESTTTKRLVVRSLRIEVWWVVCSGKIPILFPGSNRCKWGPKRRDLGQ